MRGHPRPEPQRGPRFRQTLITLKDGDLPVFAAAAGKEFSVKKSEVAERRESEQSLMPEKFGDSLPEADFNNLLAFLLKQRGK